MASNRKNSEYEQIIFSSTQGDVTCVFLSLVEMRTIERDNLVLIFFGEAWKMFYGTQGVIYLKFWTV